MSTVTYYTFNMKENLYDEDIRMRLGTIFDIGVNTYKIQGQELIRTFLNSNLAFEFEYQNPGFVAGKSGHELFLWMNKQVGNNIKTRNTTYDLTSQDYWLGYMIALFQLRTGWQYKRIFRDISYADLREMYYWCSELSEDEYVETLSKKLKKYGPGTQLQQLRKKAGFTQIELANKVGISFRAIQQYEQGGKDLNKAAAQTVRRLALVLGCSMEDLID